MYDLEIEEIKRTHRDCRWDIGFYRRVSTRGSRWDALGDAAVERPKFMTPLEQNYFVWGNRTVHPFSRNFELQRMTLAPQEGCMVCGAQI